MNIGFCYDLRDDYLNMGYSEEETAEFDRISTIEAIENELTIMGHKVFRIGHIKSLIKKLASGERWDIVFNICEGLYGIGREAQVPALLDAYEIPYVFSDPLVMAMSLDKALSKIVVKDAGVTTPDHHVIYSADDVAKVNIPFPLFAKPLAEGTGKGISPQSVINDFDSLYDVCLYLLENFRQPVLVEKFLSGREFTAGIVGTGNKARCIGVMEIILKESAEQEVYSYLNKEECEERVQYLRVNPEDFRKCSDLAVKSWIAINGQDAGRVDIRSDSSGNPNFLEVNPLAGLHPEHSDLPILAKLNGISYSDLMRMIMESASSRLRERTGSNRDIKEFSSENETMIMEC